MWNLEPRTQPTLAIQALGIDFHCHGISETNMSYLAFCEHNHSCDHMHGSLESQMKDERCLLHSSETGRACCVLPHGVDFLCMGTPCPPFSRQRPKRFASGTVKQHRDAIQPSCTQALSWRNMNRELQFLNKSKASSCQWRLVRQIHH